MTLGPRNIGDKLATHAVSARLADSDRGRRTDVVAFATAAENWFLQQDNTTQQPHCSAFEHRGTE